MSPHPRSEVDARYDLSRVTELLPLVGKHLATLGVQADIASELQQLATTLRSRIQRVRADALTAIART